MCIDIIILLFESDFDAERHFGFGPQGYSSFG